MELEDDDEPVGLLPRRSNNGCLLGCFILLTVLAIIIAGAVWLVLHVG